MTGAANVDVFPCPVFEGSEKRISVSFSAGTSTPPAGLRSLARHQLDAMLDLAACQIVSSRSNAHFDAYVLSESSLFVYPGVEGGWCCGPKTQQHAGCLALHAGPSYAHPNHTHCLPLLPSLLFFTDRMVLKTCGTTKLLSCVPYMCQLAAGVGMAPARVKYTRASFLFPEQQPAPHTSFDQVRGPRAGGRARGWVVEGAGLGERQWGLVEAWQEEWEELASGRFGCNLAACCHLRLRHPCPQLSSVAMSYPPSPRRSVILSSMPLLAWAPPLPMCWETA